MPAKSKKQQKFMAAVANNPAFAKKVGVPKSVGEEFMKGKKKYAEGGMTEYEVPKSKQAKLRAEADAAETDRKMKEGMEKYMKTRVGGGKKEKEPKMAMGGKVGKPKAYAKGGKVRGCGIAKQGVRKAKMY